jgi:hypothetical protein
MTVAVGAVGSAAMMAGLLLALDGAGPAKVYLYAGARPAAGASPTGDLVAACFLASPSGVVDAGGYLQLAAGPQAVILSAQPLTWARVCTGADQFLFDMGARLSSATNAGQELVVQATTVTATALVNIASGAFSATAA